MANRLFLSLCLAVALFGQVIQQPGGLPPIRGEDNEERRLPNGKLQQDEILKADYQKSLEDSRELATLANELKGELEKGDQNVLSLQVIKKTEEIEKLAKRIRGRMKRS